MRLKQHAALFTFSRCRVFHQNRALVGDSGFAAQLLKRFLYKNRCILCKARRAVDGKQLHCLLCGKIRVILSQFHILPPKFI